MASLVIIITENVCMWCRCAGVLLLQLLFSVWSIGFCYSFGCWRLTVPAWYTDQHITYLLVAYARCFRLQHIYRKLRCEFGISLLCFFFRLSSFSFVRFNGFACLLTRSCGIDKTTKSTGHCRLNEGIEWVHQTLRLRIFDRAVGIFMQWTGFYGRTMGPI